MDDINLYNDGKHPDNVFYKSERHTAPQKFRPKSAIVPCGDELQKRTIYGEHPLNKLDILYGECGTFDGAKRHGGETSHPSEVPVDAMDPRTGETHQRQLYHPALHLHIVPLHFRCPLDDARLDLSGYGELKVKALEGIQESDGVDKHPQNAAATDSSCATARQDAHQDDAVAPAGDSADDSDTNQVPQSASVLGTGKRH